MTEFQRFREAVNLWVQKLGLLDWDILVVEARLKGVHAQVNTNHMARAATVTWNSRQPKGEFAAVPEDVALHEVLHILLEPALYSAVQSDDLNSVEIASDEHAIIQRLCKVLGSTARV